MLRAAELLKQQTPRLGEQELNRFVQSFLDRRDLFLAAARSQGSPLYVIDPAVLKARAKRFKEAFAAAFPRFKAYFALKSNSHPLVASTLVSEGIGLDVSSGLELELALSQGTNDIVFSGPGKTHDEIELAVRHRDRVTILLDSFAELDRAERIATSQQAVVRAGVRLTTDDSGIWRKFGIPLEELGRFLVQARSCQHVKLRGMQFHISWNLNPESQVLFIARLGAELRRLAPKHLGKMEFLDIGGGFWPDQGEWLQPAATPQGMLHAALAEKPYNGREHFKRSASSIADFADHLAQAVTKHLPGDTDCTICAEPGRWLCHEAMHLLLTVIDRKLSDVVITDGGTNAVGWERFETDFFPVINLSRPGLHEHECLVAGSLCTPHDIWGYSYFGEGIEPGDILLVPNQGAYTYSLRQQFIKPLPSTAVLPHTAPVKGEGQSEVVR